MPLLCRDGLSSTPVASVYSWSGDRRRTLSSKRAWSSVCSAVASSGSDFTASVTTPAISPANSVSTSHRAIAAKAAVAARRVSTDSSIDTASQNAT